MLKLVMPNLYVVVAAKSVLLGWQESEGGTEKSQIEKAVQKQEKAKEEGKKEGKKKPKATAKEPEKTAARKKTPVKKAVSTKQKQEKGSATPGKGPPAIEVWSGEPNEPLEGGWPAGWTKKIFERPSGATKGTHDRYWYTPITKRKLRSMVEVNRFLAALEKSQGDEDEAWKIFKKKEESTGLKAVGKSKGDEDEAWKISKNKE